MFERKPNLLKRLNLTLGQNETWRKLAASTSQVINEFVHDNRWQIARIREPNIIQRGDWMDTPIGRGKVTLVRRTRSNIDASANTYDFQDMVEVQVPDQGFIQLPVKTLQTRETMVKGAKLSGFDYFSDYLQDDDYQRIHSYVGKFWGDSAGTHFVEFLGYITRNRFDIETLWEPDHGDPGSPSEGRDPLSSADTYVELNPYTPTMKKQWELPGFDYNLGHDEGNYGYYPSSHVGLSWDILEKETLDFAGIVSLFYYLAPIHLVMGRFTGTIYSHVETYSAITTQISNIPQYQAYWDNIAHVDNYLGITPQDSQILQYAAQCPSLV